jgi:hypothetical protein
VARAQARLTVASSTISRASTTSSGLTADSVIRSDIPCATTEPEGMVTNAPPRAPTRTSINPMTSSARSASRTVIRLTPNCSASSRSEARRWPCVSRPLMMVTRIWSTIAVEARPTATGANLPPANEGGPASVMRRV